MKKNIKILAILLVIIIIPVAYYGITTAMNNMEQENFYNTIKNVSDNENITDKPISQYIEDDKLNTTRLIELEVENSKTLNTSIATLKELNKSLRNETLKEYVNIEIIRMENEVESSDALIKFAQKARDYYDGKLGANEMLSYLDNHKKQTDKIDTRVDDAKTDAMEFLTAHPDIKEKFDELKIDEDFMILEFGPKSKKN
ncbi:MAG: hypothetical protein SOZ23_02710 [Methanosphaera sp.]|uniref:hypothetical protein n=1 Tax=Methanosphaera sp. TaxID=2666342 RepID=UPI0025D9351B|nr:hypothetical protein [Methanosphaera sp.]MCI5867289.1 hypothetical protein [Methanosphaera sp.]MDD6534643.1 hypothetical protein [Methanosphaera sp.]MDY3955689.1 hypothetical protein [Methanosphaera sp.]